MDIRVSGHQIDIGESLKAHVEGTISKINETYLDRAISCHVIFSRRNHLFTADATLLSGTGSGIVIKGSGEDVDVYRAFDQASERLKRQLRRYKRRLTDYHKSQGDAAPALLAKAYVMRAEEEKDDLVDTDAGHPVIIAEAPHQIETMDVKDAVMRLDLAEETVFFFKNVKNDRVNAVFTRKDGHIGWLDVA
jgi:ribosomal subunit interface protein